MRVFAFFHLNLAFSSIAAESRGAVIRQCYHPLLDMVERGYPLGIELPSWTLEQIRAIDAGWVARFRKLLHAGKCELVGSGFHQIIGPLVPAPVNRWNQKLGLQDYEAVLGIRPKIALVNEMAYASSLVPLYLASGYEGIIIDADNATLASEEASEALPAQAEGPDGSRIDVLWARSTHFQRFQRCVHDDIPLDEYLSFFRREATATRAPIAVYSGDAEIFDFRPARFEEEALRSSETEWKRVERIFETLRAKESAEWLLPSQALRAMRETLAPRPRRLSSAAYPSPVKKQEKYNVCRWSVSGRDNVWLNTICHRLTDALGKHATLSREAGAWRELCGLWSSDLRTHIEEKRWGAALEEVPRLASRLGVPLETAGAPAPVGAEVAPSDPRLAQAGFRIAVDPGGFVVTIECEKVRVSVLTRRGLAVSSLAFVSHGWAPVVGTLPQGYFDSILLGADFYTGTSVIEVASDQKRYTDLRRVTPRYYLDGRTLRIACELVTPKGPIRKCLTIGASDEALTTRTELPAWERPLGIVRLAAVTLLPESFTSPMYYETELGSDESERFDMAAEFSHIAPISSLVSSRTGVGATRGRIRVGDSSRAIELSWDPARCAALPMLKHLKARNAALTRIFFSLAELNDTSRRGGRLPPLEVRIAPCEPAKG